MSITDWPKQERPREKLLMRGAQSLSDAELLAIFLRTGIKGKTALDLARDLLNTFGGFRKLLSATQKTFCQFRGLGLAKYAQLQASLEMSQRYLQETLPKRSILTNAKQTQTYLKAKLRDYPHEVFACLFLDNRHRIIHYEELFQGTIDQATVHPREVVKKALAHNAAAVILAHNHPSGSIQPSEQDKHLTKHLQQALALVDIRVLDHIIIGEDQACSLAERGWM